MRGVLLEKGEDRVLLDVGGVGYEVCVNNSTSERFPGSGQELELFVSESVPMYGGGVTLYGFLSREEREIFRSLKEHVPNTGARKALEYLDKAAKSLPDFRRAILEKDARILAGVFGFTKKTAERLIIALKDKLSFVPLSGSSGGSLPATEQLGQVFAQALQALTALGYKTKEAREALIQVHQESKDFPANLEEWIRLTLKKL